VIETRSEPRGPGSKVLVDWLINSFSGSLRLLLNRKPLDGLSYTCHEFKKGWRPTRRLPAYECMFKKPLMVNLVCDG
jgi:hypothetical protein